MPNYRMTTETSTNANTVEGTASPAVSTDGTSRIVWSCNDVGRGITVTIRPLHATGQFVCHRVELDVSTSRAGAEDP